MHNFNGLRVGIIGGGKHDKSIGTRLYQELASLGSAVLWVAHSDGLYNKPKLLGGTRIGDLEAPNRLTSNLDIAFLATPSSGDGTAARNYLRGMVSLSDHRIPIVTAEKAALAHHYQALKPFLSWIGYSATVGGGTHLLSFVAEHASTPATQEMYLVPNGTLNFVGYHVARGFDLSSIVDRAINKGLTEPGATEPLGVLNAEIGDIALKTAIILNTSGIAHEPIKAKDISPTKLTATDLAELSNLRYVVRISREESQAGRGGFSFESGGFHVSAGFQRVNCLVAKHLPPEENNGVIVVKEGDRGTYSTQGPGAGPGPTTQAMLEDAVRLLRK